MELVNAYKKTRPYIIGIALALTVGILSAFATRGNMDIYNTIVKPPLAPPGILFPIVWSILYVLMGVSSAIIFTSKDINPGLAKDGLATYGMSLVVNFAWSIIFFNFGAYIVAFVWLLLLLGLIIATFVRYYPISRLAAFLQIPYILWVVFAGYLNLAIAFLN